MKTKGQSIFLFMTPYEGGGGGRSGITPEPNYSWVGVVKGTKSQRTVIAVA